MLVISDFLAFLRANPNYTASVIFLVGLCVGSFLNVCIYRLPDERKSVLWPRSYCPACKTPLKWYDNIPLAGYLCLRGRCRACGVHISIQYLLIELLTGLIFLELFLLFRLTPAWFFSVYLVSSLMVASVVDVQHQIIPDEVTLLGMLVALLLSYAFPELQGELDRRLGIANAILGLLVGGGLIYLTAVIGNVVFRRESMGGGDVKLLAMIGAFVGPQLIILVYFLAPIIALPIAIALKVTQKSELIPYGPYLSLAGVIVLFWGADVLRMLLGS